jgi:hypothetical protein
MPLEPLQTDEKLDKPVKRGPDMDTQMLFGCSGFVLASIGSYILAVWPFVLLMEAERLATLGLAAAIGLIPYTLIGGFLTRRFGLPGACGFVGGAMAVSIFLYLRLQQAFLSAQAKQGEMPDYPEIFQILLPVGWVFWTLIVVLIVLPKSELPDLRD